MTPNDFFLMIDKAPSANWRYSGRYEFTIADLGSGKRGIVVFVASDDGMSDMYYASLKWNGVRYGASFCPAASPYRVQYQWLNEPPQSVKTQLRLYL